MSLEHFEEEKLTNDPRLGKSAQSEHGCTGVIEEIYRYPDGDEIMTIRLNGGSCTDSAEKFTIL